MNKPNAYQPPNCEVTPDVTFVDDGPVRFVGGWYAVMAIGLLGGIFVAATFYLFTFSETFAPNPIFTSVLAWIVASLLLVSLQRGYARSIGKRILQAIGITIVGTIFFGFTCSLGSMAAGFGIYGGSISIPIVLSVVCFFLVMLFVARTLHNDTARKQKQAHQDAINADIMKEHQQ